MTFSPVNTQSSYLPVAFQLPKEDDMFYDFISKRERLTASILNVKENGQYETQEYLTAQQWFNTSTAGLTKRYTFRKVIDFGALPNASAKSVAHGLVLDDGANPSTWFFTKIYATAYDPSIGAEKIISIPYYDIVGVAIANPIGIFGDQTNVTITTTSNRTNFTRCYVTLEYMKLF
jgi:hypothetical protein